MNKRTTSLVILLMISIPSFSLELPQSPELKRSSSSVKKVHHHEHLHYPKPLVKSPEMNDLHIIIDVPDRPTHVNANTPRTPNELKKWKAKLVAATALATALITGGIFLAVHLTSCK